MLRDLVASRRGRITRAVRVFTHVAAAPPASGWYLNIHQGNSDDILRGGQPTIYFRPLICANIGSADSVSAVLRSGDVITGVRGTSRGQVVLTGGAATGNGTQNRPFLYRGALSRAAGAAVSVHNPPFSGVTSATFYGPDTHYFNPAAIPAGDVRAVGSYTSSKAPAGVANQGLLYLGPAGRSGGVVDHDRRPCRWQPYDRAPACLSEIPAALHRHGHDRAQHHGQSGGRRLRPQSAGPRRRDLG